MFLWLCDLTVQHIKAFCFLSGYFSNILKQLSYIRALNVRKRAFFKTLY